MRKPSVLVVFLTVFIDLVGFGIVLPLLPIYSRNFGASGLVIGAIMASFSAMQFLFAPVWGRWSDRVGRRPVLLISTAGAALSYALFAWGSGVEQSFALWVLLASRVCAGICGANITVAQAYIADVTPPEQRSKKMGLIGMAFGLGFIFGPALGGFSIDHFGVTGPGWVAAGLCAANFILAWFILPESWKPGADRAAARPHFAQWSHTLGQPKIGLLIGVFFLATFCFTCFETTLGLVVGENFHLDARRAEDAKIIGYLFAYCGLVGALVQGGAIGRLVKKWGEPRLIAVSLVLVGLALAPIPFIHGAAVTGFGGLFTGAGLPWLALLAVLGVLSIGSSLTRPPVFGLISMLTPAHEQGATLGVAQSAGSLARILGPIFAGGFFQFHPSLPYLVCGGISLLAAVIAWQYLAKPEPAPISAKTQEA